MSPRSNAILLKKTDKDKKYISDYEPYCMNTTFDEYMEQTKTYKVNFENLQRFYKDFTMLNLSAIVNSSGDILNKDKIIKFISEYDNLDVIKQVLSYSGYDMRVKLHHRIMIIKYYNNYPKLIEEIKNIKLHKFFIRELIDSFDISLWDFTKQFYTDNDKFNLIYYTFYSHHNVNDNELLIYQEDIDNHIFADAIDKLSDKYRCEIQEKYKNVNKSLSQLNLLIKYFISKRSKNNKEFKEDLLKSLCHPTKIQKYIEKYGMESIDTYLN
jgi:hypothetical protein